MKNEPDEIKSMRDCMNEENKGYVWESDPPSKYMILLTLFEYIDQLQGLLEGKLMYNAESQIVPRVPVGMMESGDMWYTPITFGGSTFDMLYEDADNDQ